MVGKMNQIKLSYTINILVFSFCLLLHAQGQKRIYVNAAATDSVNATGSLSMPFKAINNALSALANGDTIILSKGIYREKIAITKSIVLGSWFMLNGDTSEISQTIIDGRLTGTIVNVSSSNSQFIGFTIQNGYSSTGAGIFNSGRGNLFKNLIIKNCVGVGDINGAGAYMGNKTTVINCQFIGNFARKGAGIVFSVPSGDTSIIRNTIFRYNQATENGSAIQSFGDLNSLLLVQNNIFSNNSGSSVIHNQGNKTIVSNSNIINNNVSSFYLFSGEVVVYNSILRNNNNSEVESFIGPNTGNISINYSNIKGGYAGQFNIDADPKFIDTNYLKIANDSRCIGAGTSLNAFSEDFLGNPRPGPVGSNSDIGAYETPYKHPSAIFVSAEGGNKKIALSWGQSVYPGLKNYKIYRSTVPIPDTASSGLLTDTIKITANTFIDSIGLTNLTRYYYRIKTIDSSGVESGMSNEISARPNIPPPVVSNVKTESAPRSVVINWQNVNLSGITYDIYRSIDSNKTNSNILIKGLKVNSYSDTSAIKNQLYYYWVKAVDSIGVSSDFSQVNSGKSIPIWYVSVNGNDNNIGSLSSPRKFISTTVSRASSGDTVMVLPGIYQDIIQITGKIITLVSFKGADSTIIEKSGNTNSSILDVANTLNGSDSSEVLISGFTFRKSNPAAISNNYQARIKVTNCVFTENYLVTITQGAATFHNCLFYKNERVFLIDYQQLPASGHGQVFFNCTIYKNQIFSHGGSEGPSGSRRPQFVNSIIYLSDVASWGSINYSNSVIPKWFDVYNSLVDDSYFSNINGNQNLAPIFINESSNNYRLSNSSPGLGIGKLSHVYNGKLYNIPDSDFDGNPRRNPSGTRPDAGAFENENSFPPPSLNSAEGGNRRVMLTWSQTPFAGLSKFKLYRSTTPISDSATTGVIVDTLRGTSTRFVDSIGLVNLTRYYYRIKSIDSSGVESKMSNELSVKPNIPPSRVINFKAEGGPRSINLSWEPLNVTGITYNIYRSLDSNSNSSLLLNKGLKDGFYSDTVLSRNQTYFYWVKAVDSVGAASEYSNLVSAKIIPIWYVSSSIGSDANIGSFSSPVKTISKIISRANSGDTIKVFPGVYADNIDIVGKVISIISLKGADSTILETLSYGTILNYTNTALGTDSTEVLISGFTFRKANVVGLYNNNATRLRVLNCVFTDNYLAAVVEGPAFFQNCVFYKNRFPFLMEVQTLSQNGYGQVFMNCTVFNNQTIIERGSEGPVGSRRPQFINSIIYMNNGGVGPTVIPLWFDVHNSLVDDSYFSNINGNQNLAPIFINESSNNYRLSNSSPGLGIGKLSHVYNGKLYNIPDSDFDGNPRRNPSGTRPDVGAFENENSFPPPSLNSAEGGNRRVVLTWSQTPFAGLSKFKLYRSTTPISDSAATGVIVDTLRGTSTRYVDSIGLVNLTRYYYRIKSVDSSGVESKMSNEIYITPNTPPSKVLNFTGLSNPRSIRLNWARQKSFSYELSRINSNGTISILRNNIIDSTYLDSSLNKNTRYNYIIRAIDSFGIKGEYSDTLRITTEKYWFISSQGTDLNMGTELFPLKSFDSVLSKMANTDTLIFLPGTYSSRLNIKKNISIGSKYLITNDTSFIRTTIIDGSSISGNLFRLDSNFNMQKNIAISGMTIQNFPGVIFSDGNVEANITNCYIINCGQQGCNPLMTMGRYSVIKNCLFENNKSYFNFNNPIDIDIYNNIFKNNTQGCEVLFLLDGAKYHIYNNLFIENKTDIFRINYSDTIFVSHNTFYSTNSKYYFLGFGNWNSNKAIVTDNILSTTGKEFYFWNATISNNYTISNNLLSNYISSYNGLSIHTFDTSRYGLNKIISDSDFRSIDAKDYNFNLNNWSSAIGKASGFNNPGFDISYNPRPNPIGSKSDIGAFESPFKHPSPTILNTEGGNRRITLTWSQVSTSGLRSFKIYRSIRPISDTSSLGIIADNLNTSSTTYVDSIGLTNLTRYYYRMRSLDSSGVESGMSNELSVMPNTPPPVVSNLRAEGGPKSVIVAWDAIDKIGTTYSLYKSLDSNKIGSKLLVKGLTSTEYSDTAVIKNQTYYYWIKAVDSVGATSDFSISVKARIIPIWYVSANGNDQNRGTSSRPLKTITTAIFNLKNGDTILVNSGIYNENINTAGKLFTLKSMKGPDSTFIQSPTYGNLITFNTIQTNRWGNNNDTTNVLELNGFTIERSTNPFRIEQYSRPFITNCIIRNNSNGMDNQGSPLFQNCIFYNNGGFCFSYSDTTLFGYGATFINCTITKLYNTFSICSWQGGWKPLFINCIISGRAGAMGDIVGPLKIGPGFNIFNSIVDDQDYSKINSNDSLKLVFENVTSQNFRLKQESAGIGMGVSQLSFNNRIFNSPKFDMDGNPRPNPVGSKPDVGAFENLKRSPVPFLSLIQRNADTALLSWEFFDKSKVSKITLYRDTSQNIDTSKAFRKVLQYTNQVLLRDTLPASSFSRYFYTLFVELKDKTISEFSNIQAANGIVKNSAFLPPMVNARYAWGDIDSDGDMDLAVMGEIPGVFLQIYKNENGVFTALLTRTTSNQLYKGTLKFSDIDNDGDIDLFASGQKTSSATNLGNYLFLNNGSGSFTSSEITTVIPTKDGDAAFGDHDNDGDLDLALSGIDANGISRLNLYNNDGRGSFLMDTRFFNNNAFQMYGTTYADIAWVDYDNDGDQDFIYTAGTNNNCPGCQTSGIFRNTTISDSTNQNFSSSNNVSVVDFGLKNASFDLADLNKDGLADMVISGLQLSSTVNGTTENKITKIIYNLDIRNNNNYWYNSGNFQLLDSISGKVKLADFDNDGDMDILFAGTDQLANPRTIFYINSGDGRSFTRKTYEIIPNLDMAGFSWADYDNDKDLDLVISGQKPSSQGGNVISEIYSFEPEKKNLAPNKPMNVNLQDFGDGRILVKWDAATDDLNPTGTLNYLVKIGTVSLGGNIGRPFTVVESNKNGGNLLNPEAVLVYSNRYFTQLDPGKYYVLVQSVDNNKLTSVFSDTLFLTLTYPWKIVNQGGIVDATIGGNTSYSAKWGDIDRDNDYDFVYGGTLYESNRLNYRPALYSNDANWLLNQMIRPNVKWNDLNQDGIPDLIFSSSETISPLNATQEKFRLNIYLNDTSVISTDPITKQITTKGRLTRANISPEDSIYLGSTRFKISDINNDGKPDIMFAGLNKSSESRLHIFSTGPLPGDTSNAIRFRFNRLKTNLDSILLAQESANLLFDFGDVDGDNDNDFVAIYNNALGDNLSKVYINKGIDSISGKVIFSESNKYNFDALSNATIDLIDFDKDGDLDLITSGRSFSSGKQFLVYESKDSSFRKLTSSILPFESGKTSFGDVNNDGFTDIIYSGSREGAGFISKIALFDPVSRKFTEQTEFAFGDYQNLNIEFGDFDADNDLDILLYGREKTSNRDLFRVYKNVQNESAAVLNSISTGGKANFAGQNEILISSRMNPVGLTGFSELSNKQNVTASNTYNRNAPPSVPENIKESLLRKVQNKMRVRFSWDASSDDKTPVEGLTYELRVGTKPGSSDVVVSSSKENGYKLIPEEGNVGRNKAWEIELPAGKYFWSVQAVDASLAGSAFAPERQFSINATGGICNLDVPVVTLVGPSSLQICQGDTAILRSSVTGNLQWYKGDTLISNAKDTILKVASTGNYKVINNSGACNSGFSNIMPVVVNTLPGAGTLSTGNSIPCEGSNLILTASSDSVIAWYKDNAQIPAATGKTLTVTATGSYSIVSRGVNGCVSKLSTPLAVNFKPVPKSIVSLSNKVICEGSRTNLTVQSGTNYTYQWSRNDSAIAGATAASYSAGNPGIYKVKVTLDGCSSMSTGDTLIVNGTPSAPKLSSSKLTECEGVKINITSNDTTKLLWYRDTTLIAGLYSSSFEVSTSGTYSAMAVLNSCFSNRSNTISVTIKPVPKSEVTITSKSICEGAKTNLTAQSGTNYTYQWSRNGTDIAGATSATYAAGDSGIYKVKVSLDGCSSVSAGDTLRVFPVPPKPTISRNNTDLVSSGSAGNQWYLDGTAVVGATAQNFKPSASGYYTVKVKLNGCESVVSESYYFLITSVVTLDNGQFIKVYPNPIDQNGVLMIERRLNDEGRGLNVKVLDALGRKVLNRELKRSETTISIPGAAGTYFVQLSWGNIGSKIFKIYKK
jgi:fibronectin type 3 domain-containing protein